MGAEFEISRIVLPEKPNVGNLLELAVLDRGGMVSMKASRTVQPGDPATVLVAAPAGATVVVTEHDPDTSEHRQRSKTTARRVR